MKKEESNGNAQGKRGGYISLFDIFCGFPMGKISAFTTTKGHTRKCGPTVEDVKKTSFKVKFET